jgi:hypothetical protein
MLWLSEILLLVVAALPSQICWSYTSEDVAEAFCGKVEESGGIGGAYTYIWIRRLRHTTTSNAGLNLIGNVLGCHIPLQQPGARSHSWGTPTLSGGSFWFYGMAGNALVVASSFWYVSFTRQVT